MLAWSLRRLAEETRSVGRTGDDSIRMDKRVVPVSAFGTAIMRVIHNATAEPVNVHLMEFEPDRSFAAYPPDDGISSGINR